MNTKLVMTTSAVAMIAAGVVLSFLPDEVLAALNEKDKIDPQITLVLQVTGALYFAFGMVNWMARANLIGGIYGRPIAIGNLSHFVIGGLALLKGCTAESGTLILGAVIVYIMFAILFSIIFFTHPVREKTE